MTGAKRLRAAKPASIPPALAAIRETNPALYEWRLCNHVLSLPVHPAPTGWWCTHPHLMADLLTFTAEEPETPEKTAVWLDFRCACAKQLAQCKACAREYHRAVASWELELSKKVPRKLAQRRIRALVCWDFERLHPRLRRSPLLGGGAASEGLTIAEARQAEALCREAFLECLLSFRLCMNPKMAETIADLFKRGTVVRTKEDVKPFIVDFGMLPSGLMALCFSQAFTVRAWAKRILAEACPFPKLADPHARSYLLRKAISHFSGPSKPKSKGESSMRTTEEARKAAWDGFGAVFVHLRKKDIHTFLKSVPDTNVIETLLSAVVDVDGAISSVAIDCAMIVLTQLRLGELDAPDLLRETSFLDGIINYFHTRANVAKKIKLLCLLPQLLTKLPPPLTYRDMSRVFWKCFGIVERTYEPHERRNYGKNLLQVQPIPEDKLQTAALRSGAALLTWYYPVSICAGTVSEPDSFGKFVVTLLQSEPDASWVWTLVQTIVFTDVFSLLQWILTEDDMNGIRKISRTKRPPVVAWRKEDAASIGRVVDMSKCNSSGISWTGPLWLAIEKGTLVKASYGNQKNPVHPEEVKLLLDLHQLIGFLDPESCVRNAEKNNGPAKAAGLSTMQCLRNLQLSSERIVQLQRIVRVRFCKACTAVVNQEWWVQLPYHSSHLFGSADKEMSNAGLKVLFNHRELTGARHVGTPSKLLAADMKSDRDVGNNVADGCLTAVRMVSALGKCTALRTYPTLLSWYAELIDSDYPKLLEHENWDWILGLALTFLRNWKESENTHDRVTFNEIVCKFLTCLRGIWETLSNIENNSDAEFNEDKEETRQTVLNGILTNLFSMNTLQSVMCRGAWARTVCALSPSWKDIKSLRSNMVLIIEYHEAQRNQLTFEHCKSIAEKAALKEVDRPLQRWAADGKQMLHNAHGSRKLQMKMDSFARSAVSKDGKIANRLVERKTPGLSLTGTRRPMLKTSSQYLGSRNSSKIMGHSSTLQDLRRGVRGFQRETSHIPSKRKLRPNAKVATASGGKTKFELLVEQEQARKRGREADLMNRRGELAKIDDDSIIDGSLGMERSAPPIIDISGEPKSEKVEEKVVLAQWRRTLKPRVKEQLYRALLQGCPSNANNRNEQFKSIPGLRDHFEDVESYVSHWEPILVSELRSSLRSLVEEEERFAENQTPEDYRGCRIPFMVEGPVESVGYIQDVSIQFSGEVKTKQVAYERGSSESQFDGMKMQMGDIVLLKIPPSKYSQQSKPLLAAKNVLGIVVKVVRNAGIFQVKLNVAFEHVDDAPGKGREIMVSRLTSLTTFHRQLDALYGLPNLSDVVLLNILEPKRSLEMKHNHTENQHDFHSEAVESRLNFIEYLRSSNKLNESQSLAVEDVIRACAPIFEPRASLLHSNVTTKRHGSVTLIQGPPGTGKTSTIISLLSTVLLANGEQRPWGRHRVRFEDGVSTTPLAPVRVLVCAPSNAAVDEIMHRLMEDGLPTPAGGMASPRMVRIGGGTTRDSIKQLELRARADEELVNMGDISGSNKASLRAEIHNLEGEIKTMEEKARSREPSKKSKIGDRDVGNQSDKLKTMKAKVEAIRESLSKEYDASARQARASSKKDASSRNARALKAMSRVLNSCSVIFATLSSAAHEVMQNFAAKPDLIVIDEAAQCGEPEALIPLTATQAKGTTHVAFVGDPKQLPATVISTDRRVTKALERSLFERIGEACPLAIHMLNTQYRMHPAIAAFPSQRFYGGLLRNGSNVISEDMSPPHHGDTERRFGPCTFLDTSRTRATETRGLGGSLFNMQEAEIVTGALASLIRRYDGTEFAGQIGVLSPYRQQVSVLKRMVSQNPLLKDADIEVSTIDGIQGREKSIIFISTVRSGRSQSIGFVDDERRMNVAITRAKHTLVVVGNATVLGKHSGLWASFISHCRSESRLAALPTNSRSFFHEARLPPKRNNSKISAAVTASEKVGERSTKRRKLTKKGQRPGNDIDITVSRNQEDVKNPVQRNVKRRKGFTHESLRAQDNSRKEKGEKIYVAGVSNRRLEGKTKTGNDQERKGLLPISDSRISTAGGTNSICRTESAKEIEDIGIKRLRLRSCPFSNAAESNDTNKSAQENETMKETVKQIKKSKTNGINLCSYSAVVCKTDTVMARLERSVGKRQSHMEQSCSKDQRNLPAGSRTVQHKDERECKPVKVPSEEVQRPNKTTSFGNRRAVEHNESGKECTENNSQNCKMESSRVDSTNTRERKNEGMYKASISDQQKIEREYNGTNDIKDPAKASIPNGHCVAKNAGVSPSVIARLRERNINRDSKSKEVPPMASGPASKKPASVFERLGQRIHATHPFEVQRGMEQRCEEKTMNHDLKKHHEMSTVDGKVNAAVQPFQRPVQDARSRHESRRGLSRSPGYSADRKESGPLFISGRREEAMHISDARSAFRRSSYVQPPTHPFSAVSAVGQKRMREEIQRNEELPAHSTVAWNPRATVGDRRHWPHSAGRSQHDPRLKPEISNATRRAIHSQHRASRGSSDMPNVPSHWVNDTNESSHQRFSHMRRGTRYDDDWAARGTEGIRSGWRNGLSEHGKHLRGAETSKSGPRSYYPERRHDRGHHRHERRPMSSQTNHRGRWH